MKTKQLDKQSFETLIWEMQQTISRMDQLIKKYEKNIDSILFSIKQSYVELLTEIRNKVINELGIKDSFSAQDIYEWSKSLDIKIIEKINNPNSKQLFRD